jgi:hypothetical protein
LRVVALGYKHTGKKKKAINQIMFIYHLYIYRQAEERKRAVLRGGEASKGPNELDDLLSQGIGIIALSMTAENRSGQGPGSLFASSSQSNSWVGEITMVNAVAAARLNELSDSIKGKDLR